MIMAGGVAFIFGVPVPGSNGRGASCFWCGLVRDASRAEARGGAEKPRATGRAAAEAGGRNEGKGRRGPRGVEGRGRPLLAGDAGAWREAQARLANAGPAALAAIERGHVLADPQGRERVRELLPLALRLSVAPRDLFRHDSLAALVREPIPRALPNAQALPAGTYNCGRAPD